MSSNSSVGKNMPDQASHRLDFLTGRIVQDVKVTKHKFVPAV